MKLDIVERLIAYRDRVGRSRHGRELLADACNEIILWRGAVIEAHRALMAGRADAAAKIIKDTIKNARPD